MRKLPNTVILLPVLSRATIESIVCSRRNFRFVVKDRMQVQFTGRMLPINYLPRGLTLSAVSVYCISENGWQNFQYEFADLNFLSRVVVDPSNTGRIFCIGSPCFCLHLDCSAAKRKPILLWRTPIHPLGPLSRALMCVEVVSPLQIVYVGGRDGIVGRITMPSESDTPGLEAPLDQQVKAFQSTVRSLLYVPFEDR